MEFFSFNSRSLFALDSFVTSYNNWYIKNFVELMCLGREYYLKYSKKEILLWSTNELYFRAVTVFHRVSHS